MWRWLWLSALVIALDQLSKQWIERLFVPFEIYPVTGFFNLTLVYNTGAAFSFLADAGGWQRWFFMILGVGVSAYLAYWLTTLRRDQRVLPLAIALLIGGALGNVIDRYLHGHVIDFLDFYLGTWHWPTFNLADSAITLGVVLFIYDSLFSNSDTDSRAAEKQRADQ